MITEGIEDECEIMVKNNEKSDAVSFTQGKIWLLL